MAQNHLAVIADTETAAPSLIPGKGEWMLMREMAASLLPTGFLPNSIMTPEQAVAIMLKGRELRVPPMQALASIVVVQGKPTCSAELMLALVQRDHGTGAMWIEESTNERCTVGYRSGNGKKFYSFTIQDARQANLAGKDTWKQYPAAMLRARAISATARMAFPGSIMGMYAPGELNDSVAVTEDGEVVSVTTGEIAERPTPRPAPEHFGEPDKWGPGTGGGPVDDEAPPISDRQRSLIFALKKELKLSDTDLHQIAYEEAGVESLTELDRATASALIDELKRRMNEPQPATPALIGPEAPVSRADASTEMWRTAKAQGIERETVGELTMASYGRTPGELTPDQMREVTQTLADCTRQELLDFIATNNGGK